MEVPDGQTSKIVEEEEHGSPLFDSADAGGMAYILVRRLEPQIERGTVGHMEPTATELDIKERFGGGKYDIEGRAANNQILKGKKRSIDIAGDPVFQSMIARDRWLRSQGAPPAQQGSPAPMNNPGNAPSFTEILTLLTTMTQQAQAQAQASHMQQLEVIRRDEERREREASEREERRTRDAREREDRLRQEAKEDDARRQREEDERRARDREHQKSMLELVRSQQQAPSDGGGAIQTFIAGMTTAMKMLPMGGGGGGDDEPERDPIVAAIDALPDTIATLMGKKRPEPEGDDEAKPAAGNGQKGAPVKSLQLVGPIAETATDFMQTMTAAGRDPEQVLTSAMKHIVDSQKKRAAAPKAAETDGKVS